MFASAESSTARATESTSVTAGFRNRRVLIPMSECFQLTPALKVSLAAHEKAGDEVTFLLIHPSVVAEEREKRDEFRFALLRGLQSQLRRYPARLCIAAAFGSAAAAVKQYAQMHGTDVIILLRQEGSEGEAALHRAASQVAQELGCETEIVYAS